MINLRPACHRMLELLAKVRDDELAGATPCTDYTVRDLVDHIDQVADGLASLAAAADGTAERSPGEDWRKRVGQHVRELGDAWAAPEAWRGTGRDPKWAA